MIAPHHQHPETVDEPPVLSIFREEVNSFLSLKCNFEDSRVFGMKKAAWDQLAGQWRWFNNILFKLS